MAKFQANGFEIDEDDPMIPLSAVMKVYQELEDDHCPENCVGRLQDMLEELQIPMHILAETDQSLHD